MSREQRSMSQAGVEPYHFVRRARSRRAIIATAAWLAGCALLYLFFNAHPVIVGVLVLFSLPALFDIGSGRKAELRIDHKKIAWRSGNRTGEMPRGQLKTVRLDTRLDFSLRMTLMTYQGGKLRLPYDCVPPVGEIEPALQRHDIPMERHFFALMG